MINSEETTSAEVEPEAQCWVKPKQVEKIRNACYETSYPHLQQRNDALVAVLYDAGLRVKELCAIDVDHVDFDDGVLNLSPSMQKQYPNGNTPNPARIGLKDENLRTLRSYLQNRWKESKALFPSTHSDRITERSVRNLVKKLAKEAEIKPYTIHGRTEPSDLHPHSLRHSVAYRMVTHEGKQLDDVKRRLRHSSILTTERTYSHFDEV